MCNIGVPIMKVVNNGVPAFNNTTSHFFLSAKGTISCVFCQSQHFANLKRIQYCNNVLDFFHLKAEKKNLNVKKTDQPGCQGLPLIQPIKI